MKKPSASLASFLGAKEIHAETLFEGGRFPNVVVACDGTVVATWGQERFVVRRSEDGGFSWHEGIVVADPGFHGGGAIVNETDGSVLVFVEAGHPPTTPQTQLTGTKLYRSGDHGKTWEQQEFTVAPDMNGCVPSFHMCEHGITLQRGMQAGRLIRPARVYDKPRGYTSAVFSDDGGMQWHASQPFPEEGTGESAITEFDDGRVYHNSRKHFFASSEDRWSWRRWAAYSGDGGETWQGGHVCTVIPDGPRYRGCEPCGHNYNGHFGLCAGLVRLPVDDADILIYSNTDEAGHERRHGTVWASFDGGHSWPCKRLVHPGPFAYSSLAAGRRGTASEGWIYLQYEGGQEHCYERGYMARFTLRWLLAGNATGDGRIPDWVASAAE